jgi:hypothetical protein
MSDEFGNKERVGEPGVEARGSRAKLRRSLRENPLREDGIERGEGGGLRLGEREPESAGNGERRGSAGLIVTESLCDVSTGGAVSERAVEEGDKKEGLKGSWDL